jgi:circadian clock protein KaiC
MTAIVEELERISTGVPGLDEVLSGGLLAQRAYLVRGTPGAGKTTLGLHFLIAGALLGEKTLFINMGETEQQIRVNAGRSGFDLTKVHFLDLSPSAELFSEVQTYDVFSPADVEREPMTDRITEAIETLKPQRVFLDAMTHFRYLSPDTYQFRRQVLSFLRFLVNNGATVLFTSESGMLDPDEDLQFMSDGILELKREGSRRSLQVAKFRGSDFRSDDHSMRLGKQGMEVFPRLLPEDSHRDYVPETISSGIPELDELLHGGLERGTVTIISGPTGVGKTTLGLQFMKEAAGRGERSVVYIFEEAVETLVLRSQAINIPMAAMQQRGTLEIVPVEPLHYTPDEFARLVRRDVEEKGTRIVMLDSISGYNVALRGEDIVAHLHALSKFLQNMGVAVLLINEMEEITGNFRATDVGISYMGDNIIFLRYLEMEGELRRAIGVLKKRLSGFERTLREYDITKYGIRVGKPLTNLRGILSGLPILSEPSKADRDGR